MLENLRADLDHYCRVCWPDAPVWKCLPRLLFTHPASLAVIWYRVGATAHGCRVPLVAELLKCVYLLFMPLVRMYSGVQIQPTTRIGPGLLIMHFGGVVITRDCEIGPNCLIYHNVNIVTMKSSRGPRIGANFYAGVGSTIIGDIIIEDDVTVGANSVVTRSIPRDAVVAGVPARILRFRLEREHNTENRTGPRRPMRWMELPASHEGMDVGTQSADLPDPASSTR